jgi:hypothetical protein
MEKVISIVQYVIILLLNENWSILFELQSFPAHFGSVERSQNLILFSLKITDSRFSVKSCNKIVGFSTNNNFFVEIRF